MKMLILLSMLLGAVTEVLAADAAFTLRPTELKERPFSDAPTLSTLPERAAVEVIRRQSSWTQVKSAQSNGWVKMLSLQMAVGPSDKRSDNGLGALFNLAQTGRANATVTTGVRGLSEEQLKNARPDPQALEKAKQFMVSHADAQRFAQDAQLHTRSVTYLAGE